MSAGLSEQARERMSRLVDGEGSSEEMQQVLTAGRVSPQAWSDTLHSWHVYHLIGDVMRSDELTGQGREDLFLARLRERLAEEPVVMAPAVSQAAAPGAENRMAEPVPARRRGWRGPLAAAAGVMVVAGVAVMSGLPGRQEGPLKAGPTLASAPLPAAKGPGTTPPQWIHASAPLLRDAQLDQYLSAHKQFGGSSALGVPSGFLRSATHNGPSR